MYHTILMLLASVVCVQADDKKAPEKVKPAPHKMRVSLQLPKQEFFLGENIWLTFVVENTGIEPFVINETGRGRAVKFPRIEEKDANGKTIVYGRGEGHLPGATLDLAYYVEVFDADGKLLPKPLDTTRGVGYSKREKVEPGKQFTETIPLLCFRRFDKPGEYRIRITHHLAWIQSDDRPHPVAEAKIKVVMPTPDQARAVVETKIKQKEAGVSPGFGLLHYAVYYPPLEEHARKGSRAALHGLAEIYTPQATQVLIRLLSHNDPTFALEAGEALHERLYNPVREKREELLGVTGPAPDAFFRKEYRKLMAATWRPEFAPAVRKVAIGWLHHKDLKFVQCGIHLLQCVGEGADGADIVRALDRTLANMAVAKSVGGDKLVPHGLVRDLEDTLELLVTRGMPIPPQPGTTGEAMAYALAIGERKDFRPKDWETVYASILKSANPHVRVKALRHLPDPAPASFRPLIGRLLFDKDKEVQMYACRCIEHGKLTELRPQVLEVLKTTRDGGVFWMASQAGYIIGVERWDYLQLLVSRLDEEGMTAIILWFLEQQVTGEGRSPSSMEVDHFDLATGRKCKAAWTTFLKDNEAILRTGLIKKGDPALKPELFPKAEPPQRIRNRR